MGWAEALDDWSRKEGARCLKRQMAVLARGYGHGLVAGKANVLARFLERRFGAVPVPLRQRIFSADNSSIEEWVERAFDAPDLQSVFESNCQR